MYIKFQLDHISKINAMAMRTHGNLLHGMCASVSVFSPEIYLSSSVRGKVLVIWLCSEDPRQKGHLLSL